MKSFSLPNKAPDFSLEQSCDTLRHKSLESTKSAESLLPPLHIGKITVTTPVILSPMAGVTNWPFRVLCSKYAPDGLYVAEMITARALIAANPKALRLLKFAPSEKIRSLQLYGVNPAVLEEAARIVVRNNYADHIDLNFGCPVPKVTRRGGGSALPWKLDIFQENIHRVVRVCNEYDIPVTAKMRVGIDDDHLTFMEAAHIAQEEGIQLLTLHARTTAQYYGGHSQWEYIKQLKDSVSIPVVGNGDIWTAQDAKDMVKQTGCDGVAIGRGCQGRPWLFGDIAYSFKHKNNAEQRITNPTLREVCDVILEHARFLVDFYDGNEEMAVRDIRKHTSWYLKGFPVGGDTRRALMESTTIEHLENILNELDLTIRLEEKVLENPRGRMKYQKRVHVPYGWLDSRITTSNERLTLFGDDPMDSPY